MSTSIVINTSNKPSINVVNGRGKAKNTIPIDQLYTTTYKVYDVESIEYYKNLVQFVIDNNPKYYDGFGVLKTKFTVNPYENNMEYDFERIDVIIEGLTYSINYRWIALISQHLINPPRKYTLYKLQDMGKTELLSILFNYMIHMDVEKRNGLLPNISEMKESELVQIIADEAELEYLANLELFYSGQFPKMVYIDHMVGPNGLSYETINKWIYFCPEEYVQLGEWLASIVKIEK